MRAETHFSCWDKYERSPLLEGAFYIKNAIFAIMSVVLFGCGCRVVKEIMRSFGLPDWRFTRQAMECLHVATETEMTLLFELSQFLVAHASRVTLKTKDVHCLGAVMDAAGVPFPKTGR